MNEYKANWLSAVNQHAPNKTKTGQLKPELPDMMRLVRGDGAGKDKFERILLPMVEQVVDVAVIMNPFMPPRFRLKAGKRILDRMSN